MLSIQKSSIILSIAVFFLFNLLINLAQAQPGTLDFSFDNDGIVTLDINPGQDYGYAVALQPDKKIIIGGISATTFDGLLARLNEDGSMDSSFGINGLTYVADYYGIYSTMKAITVLSDSSIIAAGDLELPGIMIHRFKNNGSIDSSFGTNGFVIADCGATYQWVEDMAIQEDGRIVVAGWASEYPSGTESHIIARFLPQGIIDSSFGTSGFVLLNVSNNTDGAHAMAIQQDGKIVVGGDVYHNGSQGQNFCIIRLNTDGTLDSTFAGDGIVSTDLNGSTDEGWEVKVLPDETILMGGFGSVPPDDGTFALVKYHANGDRDSSFGNNGIVLYNVTPLVDDFGKSMEVQTDGKIILTGMVGLEYAIARFNPDGSIDNTYGDNGETKVSVGGTDRCEFSILQPDGKFIGGGYSLPAIGFNPYISLFRLNSDFPTATEAVPDPEKLLITPNPSNGSFSISFPVLHEFTISIFNSLGKKVLQNSFEGTPPVFHIDENICNGIYLVQVTSSGISATSKLILQR